jgi:hypothetical protein
VAAIKTPNLVVEARNVIHGIGGIQANDLLVKLTTDGKAEWDVNLAWNKTRRNSATIPPEEVTAIQQRLDSIDKSDIKPQTGPYATYVDTVVELTVGVRSGNAPIHFVLTNPWLPKNPGPLRDGEKAMPSEVKSIVCEIDRLRAELTKQTLESMCDSSHDSGDAKK